MRPRRAEAGVCIVRVEAQPSHLLITVTTNRNIAQSVYSARSERVEQFVDPRQALSLVEQFLASFPVLGQGRWPSGSDA